MDYFGKRDLLFIDMEGDKDVARLFTSIPSPCEKAPVNEEE
jgi:hypothetical protein